jgi:hypothetical protein
MAQMHADESWVLPQRSQTQLSVRPGAAACGGGLRPICEYQRHPLLIRYYVANATWLACIANHTVIPAKAGTYAAWVPAFAGMTILSRG